MHGPSELTKAIQIFGVAFSKVWSPALMSTVLFSQTTIVVKEMVVIKVV